uniref:ribonuclease H n=1 Tax=Lutzomyia longipalpis TaxID=7200 RepID=A0A1B0GK10_LUTLO
HFKIFTDGSIKDEKRGFGIFFEQTKETISRKIKEEISICTVEMIAILYAIIMAIRMKKEKIVILTDSKSAILSLKNLKSEKYYESIIHQIAKKNPKIDITLQWIPSHIGIVGNDSADKAAKEGGESKEIYQVEIPKKENYRISENTILKKWQEEFELATQTKGVFYSKVINKKIPKEPWFKKKKIEVNKIKIFNRIRAGHGYTKKFLKMMKVITDENCDKCGKQEDIEHILIECDKYKNIKSKYKILNNKYNLVEIAQKIDLKSVNEINGYLSEIKSEI